MKGLLKKGIEYRRKEWSVPFILTGLIILLDQISKAYIVANWPVVGTLIKDVFDNDILVIYHVRNKAIAFSIGAGFDPAIQTILFIVLPVGVLVFLIWYYFNSTEFNRLQRWAIAGIIGGGLGNIVDRIFRSDGVVDFISVKFYGIFGLQRWPTFNVADASVVVCCLILLVSMLIPQKAGMQPEELKIDELKIHEGPSGE